MSNYYLSFTDYQYITVPDNDVLDFGTGDFTISFWIYPATITLTKYMMVKQSANTGFTISQLSTNKLRLSIIDGDVPPSTITSDTLTMSAWNYVTFVVNRASTGNSYINLVAGTAASMASSLNSISNSEDMLIGKYGLGFFIGSIDDIRLYKKALSLAEMTEIYKGGLGKKHSTLSTGTAASWASNCDTGTGTTLTDAVGSIDGTLSSDTLWVEGGIPFMPALPYHYITRYNDSDPYDTGTILGYEADSALTSTITINDDLSLLTDGSYSYTITSKASDTCQYTTESELLRVDVVNGLIVEYPATDIFDLQAVKRASGKIQLFWKYQHNNNLYMPTHFNITNSYDSNVESLNYYCNSGRFTFTTDSFPDNQEITFTITPTRTVDNIDYTFVSTEDITITTDSAAPELPTNIEIVITEL